MSAIEIVLLVAVLAGTCVQAAIGFGFALFVAPAAFAAFDAEQAVALVLLLAIAINLLVLLAEGRETAVARGETLAILIAAIPGLVFGVWLLTEVAHSTLQLLVGLVVVCGAALQAYNLRAGRIDEHPSAGTQRALELGGGAVIGALTTSVSINGPALVLILSHLGISGAALRDTLAAVLLGVSLLAVPILLVGAGSTAAPDEVVTLACLPTLLVGHRIGAALFRRLDDESHRRLVLVAAAVAGALSIVAALTG